jgi:hypothetical protein
MTVLTDEVRRDVPTIYPSSWFPRLWIVQEIVLASKAVLQCGPYSMDWDDFEAATIFLVGATRVFIFVGRKTRPYQHSRRKMRSIHSSHLGLPNTETRDRPGALESGISINTRKPETNRNNMGRGRCVDGQTPRLCSRCHH